jgi:hypothetical protein
MTSRFRINEVELAWLAGILEGEGCFTIVRSGKARNYEYPMVTVKMTDYDVIARVAQLFGTDRIYTSYLPSGKTAYTTSLTILPALEMMELLLPHMFGRRSIKIRELLSKFGHLLRNHREIKSLVRELAG